MVLRTVVIAIWYGFMWGLASPLYAYKAGETYGKLVAWIFGLSTLAAYPLSVVIGTAYATARYYLSGGPSG